MPYMFGVFNIVALKSSSLVVGLYAGIVCAILLVAFTGSLDLRH